MRAQRILIILILTVILGGLLCVCTGYGHCAVRPCTTPQSFPARHSG